MSSATERDCLLPRADPRPEVLISYFQFLEESHTTEKELPNPPIRKSSCRSKLRTIMSTILGISLFMSVVLMVLPQTIYDQISKQLPSLPHPQTQTIEQRVSNILNHTPLIDGHNDLAILIRFLYNNQIYDAKFTTPFENGGMPLHVDIPRLREGKNGGAFWSAFVPCPTNGSDFADENYAASVAFTLTQIDLLTRLRSAYPADFSLPPNSTTALQAFREGLFISPLAIEGLHQIGNSLSNLRLFHSLGVRYATLTHNCHNKYADAALLEKDHSHDVVVAKPRWGGISPAGKELIHEMNRIGMIVDLAHASQDTMRDVLGGSSDWEGSIAPPIYSHSSAYALCPHPRNVPDDILQLVKKRNSLVMVNFTPDFVSCVANSSDPSGLPTFYPQNSTLAHVARHVMHIGELIGYDHVGFGSDFDGTATTPEGLDDVSKYPDLVAELLSQGVSDEDVAKVVGGNILRVWGDAEEVARKLQAAGEKPLEDKLPNPGMST